MNERITGETPPAFLVLREIVRGYRNTRDRASLGDLLVEVEKAISGEEYTEPETGGELIAFRRLLEAAEMGIARYEKTARRCRAAAAASVAARQARTAPVPPARAAARTDEGEGVSIGDLAWKDPVKAALLVTGETENARSQNSFKKLLREKGARRFRDTVISFDAECRSGEEPNNRGAALTRRLKDLPDNPAKGGEA